MAPTERRFKCFSCKAWFDLAGIAASGERKNGSQWHVCLGCRENYVAEKKRKRGSVRVGEKSSVELGWNGVPSETALRRRRMR